MCTRALAVLAQRRAPACQRLVHSPCWWAHWERVAGGRFDGGKRAFLGGEGGMGRIGFQGGGNGGGWCGFKKPHGEAAADIGGFTTLT